jgi:tRNA A37 threonylcarbamoyladenosine dehydratase
MNEFQRTKLLLGNEAMERLERSRVIVFGVGGVGGYVVEVLARSGVGMLALVDNDRVSLTNLNRQIIALHSTLDRLKVDVFEERIHDINPACKVEKYPMFYLPENASDIDLSHYDYVVDCIDTVKAKLELVRRCHRLNIPIISSMGAANKLNPTAFRVADISKTCMDPLAKAMRTTLRREGIQHLKVVFSDEPPLQPVIDDEETKKEAEALAANGRRSLPASCAFVPAAAGLVIGSEVVKDLIV